MKKILLLLFVFVALMAKAQVANPPSDLSVCDDDNDGFAQFDLTVTAPEILGSQNPSDFIITYHESQADVTTGENAILNTTSYTNSGNPQIIFVRVEEVSTGSFAITNFYLTVTNSPSLVTPTPLVICDDDNDGFSVFDLTIKDAEILDGAVGITLGYYETELDALAGMNQLASPYANITPYSQIVFARATNDATGCFAIVELELIVLDGCPIITQPPAPIYINDGDANGMAIFDLRTNETMMLGSQDPSVYLFSYHITFDDSDSGMNAITNPEAYQNVANPQTIYARLTNSNNQSYALTDFEIEADGVLGVDANVFSDMSIFPNPTSERITIQSQFLASESNVSIYTLQGRQVFSEILQPENGKITIPVSEISSGIYLLKLTSEGYSITKKLLKQ
ncbi:T9SS type A sorting domain-containing protein [Ulvibacter litoralis]|uniref:Por secretion system C-terminal sorting domain-containing protein n=1 Tax=Ulvibacter litoralis TaxID=227084 RepID=A0A1G7EQU6_9FLAO|nr:T9SS type A sorting domain-containing protein [Ulvibacter litoralis]SDE66042.1 Por secretion system C-terminal sorting domain-containing protein [Ulvibacter litoralis]